MQLKKRPTAQAQSANAQAELPPMTERIESFHLPLLADTLAFSLPEDELPKALLVVYFSPFDCSTCLDDLIEVEMLHQDFLDNPEVVVIGIGCQESRRNLNLFCQSMNLTFPVLFDSTETFLSKWLLSERHPQKILFNNQLKPSALALSISNELTRINQNELLRDEIEKLLAQ